MKTKEVQGRIKIRNNIYDSDNIVFSRYREDGLTPLDSFIKKTFGDKVILEITMKVVRYVED